MALGLLTLLVLMTPALDGPTPDQGGDAQMPILGLVAIQPEAPTQDERPRLDLSTIQIEIPLNEPVQSFLDDFTGRGRLLYARWSTRMALARPTIEPILLSYGLPTELIYVCMIESGFNVDAVSRASAVGPWQFMVNTGREYGLRQDAWVDERRDLVKSTHAAAKHFRDLFDRYQSWPLAFAAYNAGVGAVNRAIRLMGTNDFWRIAELGGLPSEATRYVPKIMAAIVAGHNLNSLGFGQVKAPIPPLVEVIQAPPGRDLDELAKSMKTSGATLKSHNPELLRGYTPPYGEPYPLKVPAEVAQVWRAQQARRDDRKPRLFVEHRVRFGETIRYLAARFGVNARTLRRDNRIPSGEPAAGQVLIIPKSGKPGRDPLKNQLVVLQDPGLEFELGDRQLVFFPVLGDLTLSEVAGFFKVSSGHIAMWNGLDPLGKIQRGMLLRLYLSKEFDVRTALLRPAKDALMVQAGTTGSLRALRAARRGRGAGVERRKHTVKKGQTLWKIAKRYGVTVAELRGENGLQVGQGLSPGQTIVVPRHIKPKPKGPAARKKAKLSVRGRRYRVRRGDSLWKIARKFQVPVTSLRRKNRLRKRASLRPGQTLIIPRR